MQEEKEKNMNQQPMEVQQQHQKQVNPVFQPHQQDIPEVVKQKVQKKKNKRGRPKKVIGQKSEEKPSKNPPKRKLVKKKNTEKQVQRKQQKKKPAGSKAQQKDRNLGGSAQNGEQEPARKRYKYCFYIKTRFTHEYKSQYTFPKTDNARKRHKDNLIIRYISQIECLFTQQIKPGSFSPEYKLANIESVFMVSYGVKLLGDPTKSNYLRSLLKKIRYQNPDAKICIETDKIWDKQYNLRKSYKELGFYPILNNQKENSYEKDINSYLDDPEQKKLSLILERWQKNPHHHHHSKIWLIKFSKDNEDGTKSKRIRIVITSANLDNLSWDFGTNMFWVQDFDYIEEGEVFRQPDPYFDELFKKNNLSEDFIRTLDEDVFEMEKKWNIFNNQFLDINFQKIKAQNINFVLIPSKPYQSLFRKDKEPDFPSTLGLEKIEKFTKEYFANTTGLQDYKSSQLHLITPNYVSCDKKLIHRMQKAFLNEYLNKEGLKNRVFLHYPTNNFVYNRIYQECSYLEKDQANALVDKISHSYFALQDKHLKDNYAVKHFNKQAIQIKEKDIVKIEEQQQIERGRQPMMPEQKTDLNTHQFPFISQKNTNHRRKQYKHIRTQGFSAPHLKAYYVLFKKQKTEGQKQSDNIHNKNIFYFGSHNLTGSAFGFTHQYTVKAKPFIKYNHYINTSQLGMLFFDVPGLFEHVLPMSFNKTQNLQFETDIQPGSGPLSKPEYLKWHETIIQPMEKDFNQTRNLLRQYMKKYGEKRKCLLDYTLVEQVGSQCQQLISYIHKTGGPIQQAYSILRNSLKYKKLGKVRTNLIDNHNQGNPDAKFCYQNNLKVFMTADAVIVEDGKVKQVWYVESPHRRRFPKMLSNEVIDYFKDANLKFYILSQPQIFKKKMRNKQKINLQESDMAQEYKPKEKKNISKPKEKKKKS